MKTYGEKNADWIKPNVWLINRAPSKKPNRFDRLLQQIRDNPDMTEQAQQDMVDRLLRCK